MELREKRITVLVVAVRKIRGDLYADGRIILKLISGK
jgi:hypothetical protein